MNICVGVVKVCFDVKKIYFAVAKARYDFVKGHLYAVKIYFDLVCMNLRYTRRPRLCGGCTS